MQTDLSMCSIQCSSDIMMVVRAGWRLVIKFVLKKATASKCRVRIWMSMLWMKLRKCKLFSTALLLWILNLLLKYILKHSLISTSTLWGFAVFLCLNWISFGVLMKTKQAIWWRHPGLSEIVTLLTIFKITRRLILSHSDRLSLSKIHVSTRRPARHQTHALLKGKKTNYPEATGERFSSWPWPLTSW